MNNLQFFAYLLVLAGSTNLIRVIPFVAIKEKINNKYVRSFLYYIPYAVLTAMTLPAAFYATRSIVSALVGIVVAIILAYKNKSLTVVAIFACLAVYITELFI
ncbi:MAG: AzlD domain-containing protein [Lachnospiraceae bacterium]|nr:AzlD domain-containing protein [Lachnospiraceae bacterium]